jgi:hypothetical protein
LTNLLSPLFLLKKKQVKSGELPVLDARVRAIIQFTGTPSNQDSTSNNTLVLDLFDNGNAGNLILSTKIKLFLTVFLNNELFFF